MTIHATRGLPIGFLAIALAAGAQLGGCTFDDSALESLTCTTDADCDSPRTCVQGYCLEVDGAGVCGADADCSDGLFCNGAETCNPEAGSADVNGCLAGAAPTLSDGYDCTEDICDEAAGEVRHIRGAGCICATEQDHQACDAVANQQGLTCVTATCNDQLGCDFPPAMAGTVCGEAQGCLSAGQCDDGGQCQRSRDDAMCDDADACNGAETCNPDGTCAAGDEVDPDDGIACTVDSCADGSIINDASACDCIEPGAACDCVGERCQPGNQCVGYICSDNYTCGADDVAFRAAGTSCNDDVACTFDDICDGAGACGGSLDHNLCSNFDLCDGEEICDPDSPQNDINGCISGNPPNINDGIDCTIDSCTDGQIMHVPDGCALCDNDAECLPDNDANPCLRYFCNDICMTEPRPEGTMCDDGRGCTDGDTCDPNGQCVGRDPNDTFCNDQMWCDGIEICQPNHQQADADGCRPGPAPDPDDDVDCTDDTCVECDPDDNNCTLGLEGDFLNTPTERCECINDVDCAEQADVCFLASCNRGSYTCNVQPAQVGTDCDDGLACTDGDACDADQNCVPQTDNCDCEVNADCTDDDDNVCILAGACSDGVCQYTFASDDTACGELTCTAGSTCDGVGQCDVILNNDVCAGSCRAGATCAPGDVDADADGCVYEPANEGACVVNCGNGDIDGTCVVGTCQAPPEGPTGTDLCDDLEDNDCDGEQDGDDSDCATPDTVVVGGEETGTVGQPVTLTVTATTATNQAANLYCVGRLERWYESFDDPAVIADLENEENPQITPIGVLGDDVASGVSHDGATGLKVCNGKGLLLGPFAQPALADQLGLMLRVRMKNMNPTGLGAEEHFVVSYRNSLTGNDGEDLFLPVIALDSLDVTMNDYQNVFFNAQGVGSVTIRLELIKRNGVTDPDRCAFVDSVGIYEVPWWRADADAIPEELDYLRWTWNNITEDAIMYFEDIDQEADIAAFFFADKAPPQGHTISLEARAKHTGSLGLAWINGPVPGSILLPPVTEVPEALDRSRSMRLDWAMAMRNRAQWLAGDAMHTVFGVGDDVASYRKIGSALPEDTAGPYLTQYEAGGNRDGSHKIRHRFVSELPEAMKPLLGRRLGLARPGRGGADHDGYLDDVDLYVRSNSEYMSFAGTGPQNYDSTVHEVTMTSEHDGLVHVQCYWQLPGTEDTPTIASAPYYVTITE